jgi:hypothetical protein
MNPNDISHYWSSRNIRENDWKGLSRVILVEIFNDPELLVPIENVDSAGFKIEVEHLNLGSFVSRLWEGKLKDGFEVERRIIPRVISPNSFPVSEYIVVALSDLYSAHSPLEHWLGISQQDLRGYYPYPCACSTLQEVLSCMHSDPRLQDVLLQ